MLAHTQLPDRPFRGPGRNQAPQELPVPCLHGRLDRELALRPGYVEPLAQLAAMALADRQPEAALTRVRQQLALEPSSAPIHALLGGLHLARREGDRAKAAFLRAVDLEPRLIER